MVFVAVIKFMNSFARKTCGIMKRKILVEGLVVTRNRPEMPERKRQVYKGT